MKTDITVYRLNAFSKDPNGGNPAAVVLDADHLHENQMLALAKEIGFSETAFVMGSETCDYRVRFFTPASEVALCGHATIAVYSLMWQLGLISSGTFIQELEAGKLAVYVEKDGKIRMEQTAPEFGDTFLPDEIAPILGLEPDRIHGGGFPIQVVSTGLSDVLVPVASLEALNAVTPDFKTMAAFNKKTETVGFHVFYTETMEPAPLVHCRNFAPLYEIEEESATGSSCGALACYLHTYAGGPLAFTFRQGISMGRPSVIYAALEAEAETVTRVFVGGEGGAAEKMIVSISEV